MRKLLFLIFVCAAVTFAQIGLDHSAVGLRVPSARTLGQGILYLSGNYSMVSDGKSQSMEGYYIADGKRVNLEKNTPSNDENFYIGFGILENLELGLNVPLHYDGDITNSELNGIGFGDIHLAFKGYALGLDWFHLGYGGQLIAPTGAKSIGFRPRHRYNIAEDGKAYAYTADSWLAGGNVYMSLDVKNYVTFNNYFSLMKGFSDVGMFLLWGGGLNIFPEKILTVIFEVSGEFPIRGSNFKKHFLNSPFRFTPAFRLHTPHDTYLTIFADIGFNYFRSYEPENGVPVHLVSGGSNIDYSVSGSPTFAVGVSLSKKFDFSWSDEDGDGVIDRKDLCPNTGRGQAVNSRGCPVDEDRDGVLNIVDLCPRTPLGVIVGRNGCPLDFDHDGVPDYLDKCLGTKAGFAVDSSGCVLDSDGDGIDDNNDKCPGTIPGDPVDDTGCPLDEDHDGVPNDADLCPHTPEDVAIDLMGCPLDQDEDGVPDDYDQCPNSLMGEIVDSVGCPKDSDNDGISDTRDLCPGTQEGVSVNSDGCRVDVDMDGVFDEEDKCPGTPEGAVVDSVGCPVDSDHDGIPDWMDDCPGTLENVVVDIEGCPMNARLNFNSMSRRIKFKPGDTTLVNSSYTALSDVIAAMRKHPMVLEIQCTANDVSKDRAMELSEARARSIYNFLEKKGIKTERILYKGFGNRLPPTQTQKNGSTAQIRLVPILVKDE